MLSILQGVQHVSFVSVGKGKRVECSYFYDAALKKFEEQCLPSLFNEVKRRQRERDIEKPMLLSEENVQNLPSSVGMERGCEV